MYGIRVTVAAIQPNGEQLLFEPWAYEMWQRGECTDPMICGPLSRAVEIRPFGWPRTDWERKISSDPLK